MRSWISCVFIRLFRKSYCVGPGMVIVFWNDLAVLIEIGDWEWQKVSIFDVFLAILAVFSKSQLWKPESRVLDRLKSDLSCINKWRGNENFSFRVCQDESVEKSYFQNKSTIYGIQYGSFCIGFINNRAGWGLKCMVV